MAPCAVQVLKQHWSVLCSHAIVSSLVGPEYYVNIMSFVDKGQLEPGCSILLHNKVCCYRQYCMHTPMSTTTIYFTVKSSMELSLGCSLQVLSVVGILQDEADPMVSVMKVRAPSHACLQQVLIRIGVSRLL